MGNQYAPNTVENLKGLAMSTDPSSINPIRVTSFADYRAKVMSTELFPEHLKHIAEAPSWNFRWFHGVFGLVSEQSELLTASDSVNRYEELGDRFWYHALLAEALDSIVGSEPTPCMFTTAAGSVGPVTHNDLTRVDATLADLSKRLMFYSKKPPVMTLYAAALESLSVTVRYAKACNIDNVLHVMEGNINKLAKRKADAARKKLEMGDMDRDLNAERASLEASAKLG